MSHVTRYSCFVIVHRNTAVAWKAKQAVNLQAPSGSKSAKVEAVAGDAIAAWQQYLTMHVRAEQMPLLLDSGLTYHSVKEPG